MGAIKISKGNAGAPPFLPYRELPFPLTRRPLYSTLLSPIRELMFFSFKHGRDYSVILIAGLFKGLDHLSGIQMRVSGAMSN
jgi:hypothetical protein